MNDIKEILSCKLYPYLRLKYYFINVKILNIIYSLNML